MLDENVVLKRSNDVRYRVVGDEAVVVRQDAAEVLALNDVGARVLELIDEKIDLGGMIDRMLDEYEVERAVLSRDIEAFVREIRDAGIVEPFGPTS